MKHAQKDQIKVESTYGNQKQIHGKLYVSLRTIQNT